LPGIEIHVPGWKLSGILAHLAGSVAMGRAERNPMPVSPGSCSGF
jgi:hypothetical protein